MAGPMNKVKTSVNRQPNNEIKISAMRFMALCFIGIWRSSEDDTIKLSFPSFFDMPSYTEFFTRSISKFLVYSLSFAKTVKTLIPESLKLSAIFSSNFLLPV